MTLLALIERSDSGSADAAAITSQLGRLDLRGELKIRADVADGAPLRLRALHGELERAAQAGSAVAVLAASLVVPDAALLRLIDDPGLRIGALVASTPAVHPVATQGAAVLAASTELHPVGDPDAGFLGALYVAAGDVALVARALQCAVQVADPAWDTLDLLDLVLMVLVRSGAAGVPAVTAVRLEPFPGARVHDGAEARELRAAIARSTAEPDLAERNAARAQDGFYSTFVLRRISARITPWAVRHGVAPNTVTSMSALVGLAGAAAFALGSYPALLVGAVLLQASLVLDCVDGEIARATRTRSAFGAWLDGATDRVKEYAALAGLALAGAQHGHHLWTLATAAMIVQTVRHMQDFAFSKGVLAAWRASFRDGRPLTDTGPWPRPRAAAVDATEPTSAWMWVRRVIHLPIGERWLVLSVAAACGSPAAAIVAYLSLTSLAELWSLLGAIRRTTAEVGPIAAPLRRTLADYRDDGLLGLLSRGRSPGGVAGWLLPPLVTAVEGAGVLAATVVGAPQWTAAAFGWFAVIAWHRYDIVYRRGGAGASVPTLIDRLGGGWLVRTALVLAGAAAGELPGVLIAGIGWLGLCYVPESLANGWRTRRAA